MHNKLYSDFIIVGYNYRILKNGPNLIRNKYAQTIITVLQLH